MTPPPSPSHPCMCAVSTPINSRADGARYRYLGKNVERRQKTVEKGRRGRDICVLYCDYWKDGIIDLAPR